MAGFSLVVALDAGDRADLHARFAEAMAIEETSVEIVIVDRGRCDRKAEVDAASKNHSRISRKYVHSPETTAAGALNIGVLAATSQWVIFYDSCATLTPRFFRNVSSLSCRATADVVMCVAGGAGGTDDDLVLAMDEFGECLQKCKIIAFRRDLVLSSNAAFCEDVRPGFLLPLFCARFLLSNPGCRIGVVRGQRGFDSTGAGLVEPFVWADLRAYDAFLENSYLAPLRQAASLKMEVPRWLQKTVALDLQAYFSKDLEERSPTVVVDEQLAARFHGLVREVMNAIDEESIGWLAGAGANAEVLHALLAYKCPECRSPVRAVAFDEDQGLLQLAYYIHGARSSERFLTDGVEVAPAYSKYRGARFYRRQLFAERIVWLPVENARELEVALDDRIEPVRIDCSILVDSQSSREGGSSVFSLSAARRVLGVRGRRRGGVLTFTSSIKVWLLRLVSRVPVFRKRFTHSWLFVDRHTDADDNAEHLYRWVKKTHPEINAWFLLRRTSPDWPRLEEEGFRLLPPGWRRKIAVLNCDNIISSHLDFVSGGFDAEVYSTVIGWRYIFLQHGVAGNDLSHWFNGKPIDVLVSSSPSEFASIVEDGSPYTFTEKEVRFTGLPRHDRLLEMSASMQGRIVDLILVMPTWRSSIDGASIRGASGLASSPETSNYFLSWSSVLGSEDLRALAEAHGKRIAFMPHPNAERYLDLFVLPPHVEVVTRADIGLQQLFCQTAVLVTDYSSVAFEMAVLRRPVIYYQFDRAEFFGGAHNWREGYFSYDADGFGPVVEDREQLICAIGEILQNGCRVPAEFVARMERAMPASEEGACRRVFESIRAVRRVYHSAAER